MNEAERVLLQRHRRTGVLIDTNILLLLFVGAYDRIRIPHFKRTAKFTPNDYDLLLGLVGSFDRAVTTPQILTEVSNLAGQLDTDRDSSRRATVFAAFRQPIEVLDEQYVRSAEIARMPAFLLLGLTDAGIVRVARDGGYLVLTDDLSLSVHLGTIGLDALNFEHIRA